MMKQLSSTSTLFFKMLVPIVSIVLLLFGSFALLVNFTSENAGQQIVLFSLWMFGLLVAGVFWFLTFSRPLKMVWTINGSLRVSNYRDEIDLPLEAIASVTQIPFFYPRYVLVQTRERTPFGRSFSFIPQGSLMDWFPSSGENLIVLELKERVKAARRDGHSKPPRVPAGRPIRSIVADDEMDGLL